MLSFVQSAFLQSLGHTIASSLWQMALIWLLYTALNTLFRFTASSRYRLAVLAQLMGFSWFMVTFATQYFYPAAGTLEVSSNPLAYMQPLSFLLAKAEPFLPWISVVYLLLISALGIQWITGYRYTQMIRTEGLQKMPVDWRLFAKRIAAQLGLRKEIRVFLSQQITTPLTIGFLKPIILLPLASINHLTTVQLEAVLLHEMAHIKRHDYLVNLCISAMELVLFFNPFSQLISKHIQKERENSCDDWVLQFQYNAAEYAEGLLRIAYLQTAPAFAMAASGKKNELLFRVKRMIGQQDKGFVNRKKILALVIVSGLLGGIAFMSPPTTPIVATHTTLSNPIKKARTIRTGAQMRTVYTKEIMVIVPAKRKQKTREQKQRLLLKIMPPAVPLQEESMALTMAPEVDNPNMDKVLKGIKNIDLEKLVADVFEFAQLTDEDKKELGKMRSVFVSERDRELLKKEFSEKQKIRDLYSTAADIQDDNTQPHKNLTPVILNVSFTTHTSDLDDEKQVARIKLDILKKLNEILLNKETKEPKKKVTHL